MTLRVKNSVRAVLTGRDPARSCLAITTLSLSKYPLVLRVPMFALGAASILQCRSPKTMRHRRVGVCLRCEAEMTGLASQRHEQNSTMQRRRSDCGEQVGYELPAT